MSPVAATTLLPVFHSNQLHSPVSLASALARGGWTEQTRQQVQALDYFLTARGHSDLENLIQLSRQAKGPTEGEESVVAIAGYLQGHPEELQRVVDEMRSWYFPQV